MVLTKHSLRIPSDAADGQAPGPAVTSRQAAPSDLDQYALLKQLITQRGLLERRPRRYLIHGVTDAAIFIAVSIGMALSRGSWWVLAWGVPAAFVFGQIAFLAHDATHNQVFSRHPRNYVTSLLLFNLILGGSRGWWADKHNLHHGQPNRVGVDPDTDFSLLAFTREQADGASGFARRIIRHQATVLWPMLSMQAISSRVHSIRFIFNRRMTNAGAEVSLLLVHYAVYFGGLIAWLGMAKGLAFAVLHQMLLGLYAAFSFLPNHIGMPMLQPGEEMTFLRRQVLTARNIGASSITDYAFGGLSCQIEHHLFPSMPRPNLRQAIPIVRAFCLDRNIPYRETGVWAAYKEVYQCMAAAVAPLRRAGAPPP